ncbi:hypothetical protein M409DRAFT_23861 [Zasmidium cellare ATCC 36951]|uniref:Uncharacterized protein n=1 Tax=Zasmidium cellare ATCC 36951 TaxID=1080233 RepID=A0A6A6CEM3_ZASCE|nr:uncharacterized protein M409DRAFT_23861 [Zasmidium cellare ATCC 36951]KAF2165565.1 hypothetical protein M409DRAFT_23861 [Zasmidium cellare ATCC 36951]
MGSTTAAFPPPVRTTLAFRLDPALGECDALEVGKHNEMKRDMQDIDVLDASGRETEFTLDAAGFQFTQHRSSFQDFRDEEAVKTEYYAEVTELAKTITGASFAYCYQHLLRASKLEGHEQPPSNLFGPANGVHVDYNYTHTPAYIKALPERPADWDRLSMYRWAIFSAWRPMSKVTRDALCVGDKTTIPDSDLVTGTTDMDRPGRKTTLGLFWVNFNPKQQYYYKKGMDTEDLLWIKLYDSKLDGRARCTPHS